jgi:hypothetical protein
VGVVTASESTNKKPRGGDASARMKNRGIVRFIAG